jgi:hypothetical protein
MFSPVAVIDFSNFSYIGLILIRYVTLGVFKIKGLFNVLSDFWITEFLGRNRLFTKYNKFILEKLKKKVK